MKRKILVLIGIVSFLCVLAVGGSWLKGEYQYYKNMHKKGKVVGATFEDCKHTARYALDYSTSLATREPIALSVKELQRLHPTVWEYMWCCGQIQDELSVWVICVVVAIGYTVIVVVAPRKKKQSVL